MKASVRMQWRVVVVQLFLSALIAWGVDAFPSRAWVPVAIVVGFVFAFHVWQIGQWSRRGVHRGDSRS